MRRDHGFTLIELMIVVTVIGILAAISIPLYQNYVIRTKVTEGIALAGPVKLALGEYYEAGGEFPDDNAALNLPPPAQLRGRHVGSVEVQQDGVVVVTFDDPALAGQTITLTATSTGAALSWACTTTLPQVVRPKECA